MNGGPAAHLFWCPFKGIDNIFVTLDVKVSLLIKIPWRPTSPKLIMVNLSDWLPVVPLPPAVLWMGSRHKMFVLFHRALQDSMKISDAWAYRETKEEKQTDLVKEHIPEETDPLIWGWEILWDLKNLDILGGVQI